jgi:hypothetical protein
MQKPDTTSPSTNVAPSETENSLAPHEIDLLAFNLFVTAELEAITTSTEDATKAPPSQKDLEESTARAATIWRSNPDTRVKWHGRAAALLQQLNARHLDVRVVSVKKAKQASIALRTIPAAAAY